MMLWLLKWFIKQLFDRFRLFHIEQLDVTYIFPYGIMAVGHMRISINFEL